MYFQLNIQLQVNSHQNVAICYIGKNQNGLYPGSCSRQVPNMFKLTKIWSPITNGMPTYTYVPSLRLLAQSLDIWPPLSTRAGLVCPVRSESSNQKVLNFDFQSQLTMSKIIWILPFFFIEVTRLLYNTCSGNIGLICLNLARSFQNCVVCKALARLLSDYSLVP